MVKPRLDFHPGAEADYATAFDWYFERSLSAAQNFDEDLAQAIEHIGENPGRWPINIYGTRRYLLLHFPFSVVYREVHGTIQILAVAHGRRRPDYWKTRL